MNEAGADQVQAVFDDCAMHALNLSEVVRKMANKGLPAEEIQAALGELHLDVIGEFDQPQAYATGQVAAPNKKTGLSLGDAVCLVAAPALRMRAVTAGRLRKPEVMPIMRIR